MEGYAQARLVGSKACKVTRSVVAPAQDCYEVLTSAGRTLLLVHVFVFCNTIWRTRRQIAVGNKTFALKFEIGSTNILNCFPPEPPQRRCYVSVESWVVLSGIVVGVA